MDRYGVRDLNAPWYAGNPSFMRAPVVSPEEVPEGEIAVVGLPIDEYATSSMRTGMRWGPRRIREASDRMVWYYGSGTDVGYLDIRSGRVTAWPEHLPLVDAGDAPVIPHDVEHQIAAARDYIHAASRTSSVTVTLGGDHFVAYPAAAGVIGGWRERREHLKVGFLHIDSHSDFVDDRLAHGKYSHGTYLRRVAEIPEVKRIAWFGLNNNSQPNQYRVMKERGFRAYTSFYVHRVGPRQAMSEALDYVTDGVDILYVSIDIDVVNNAHAPATGSAVFEGLSAHEFLEAIRLLGTVPSIVGLDMCEVDPEIDTTWRTELLAAQALLTVLGPRMYREHSMIPAEELREVFLV
jgi:agmatinase